MNLTDLTIAIIGRPDRLPRSRLVAEVARRGGRGVRRLPAAGILVLGHGSHVQLAAGGLPALVAEARRRKLGCFSEHGFLRALGLLAPLPPTNRVLTAADLCGSAGLTEDEVALLALFDLLEEEVGLFSFHDLVAAREIARLRREGAGLAEIITAGLRVMREAGERPLSRLRLMRLDQGELALRVGAYLAEASGQLRLPLDDAGNSSLDQLLAAAETAEEEAAWVQAEALYRRALNLSPRDPAVRFNLANVVRALGRRGEAKALLHEAVGLDPGFAEAWYNLAHLAEEEDKADLAARHLEQALEADPRYGDALYNLARLRLRAGAPERAAPLYERYLALDAHSLWARRARRALQLCRLRMMPGGDT